MVEIQTRERGFHPFKRIQEARDKKRQIVQETSLVLLGEQALQGARNTLTGKKIDLYQPINYFTIPQVNELTSPSILPPLSRKNLVPRGTKLVLRGAVATEKETIDRIVNYSVYSEIDGTLEPLFRVQGLISADLGEEMVSSYIEHYNPEAEKFEDVRELDKSVLRSDLQSMRIIQAVVASAVNPS